MSRTGTLKLSCLPVLDAVVGCVSGKDEKGIDIIFIAGKARFLEAVEDDLICIYCNRWREDIGPMGNATDIEHLLTSNHGSFW